MGRDAGHFRGPGRWAVVLPVVVVALLLVAAVAAHRFQVGPRHLAWLAVNPAEQPDQVEAPAGLELPAATEGDPYAEVAPQATDLDVPALRKALRGRLGDDALGRRVAVGVSTLDGGDRWSTGPAAWTPASSTKVLTSVAALHALGPDHRFETTVTGTVATGGGPARVTLVGGGDPYLAASAVPAQQAGSAEPAGADLATLAVQVRAALGDDARVRLQYDDQLFSGPAVNPAWPADYVPDDVVAPIGALMLDGGREADGARADAPAAATAAAFAAALRDAGVRVVGGPRPGASAAGAEVLASVSSAPLADVVDAVVSRSDNEGAELLLRHVGLADGGEGSFEAGVRAVLAELDDLGVDTRGVRLHDGSGLSRDNVITTRAALGTLAASAAADHPDLRAAWTGLPVAGFSGTLAHRFGTAEDGLGLVRAKTGTLTGVHALVGTVLDADGVPLLFVAVADRVPPVRALDAQAGLDEIAGAISDCSCAAGGTPGAGAGG